MSYDWVNFKRTIDEEKMDKLEKQKGHSMSTEPEVYQNNCIKHSLPVWVPSILFFQSLCAYKSRSVKDITIWF